MKKTTKNRNCYIQPHRYTTEDRATLGTDFVLTVLMAAVVFMMLIVIFGF